MCRVQKHDRVCGKASVVALTEARCNPKDVCEARVKYLTSQVESFKLWLREQGNTDPDAVIERIERDTWTTLKNDIDDEFVWSRGDQYNRDGELSEETVERQLSLSNITAGKDNPAIRMEEQETADFFEVYNIDQTAIRAMRGRDEYPSHVEQTWVDWLSKVDAVYWNPNIEKECYLPKDLWNKCRQARINLNKCRKSRMLDYETYALLSNWNFRLLGSSKRYDIADTPDPEMEAVEEYTLEQVYYTNG